MDYAVLRSQRELQEISKRGDKQMIDMMKDWFEDFMKLKSWVKVLAVVILVVLLHHWVLH